MASTAMRPVLPADNTALPIDDFDPGEPPGTVATLSATPPVPIALSPTLAANELMAARKQRGEPVLPMAFGEAGLPGAPGPAAGAGRGHRPDRLRPGGRAGRLAGVRGRVLAAARAGHRRGGDRVRAGQQGAAVRADAGHRRGCRGPPAELGQLRRAGQPDRGAAALRRHPVRRGRRTRPRPPRRRGPGGPGRRARAAVGHPHAAGQPDRHAGQPGHDPGAVPGRGRARPDHHLRRDLPGPGARGDRAVHQPGGHGPGPHDRDHLAEQGPGPGWLADRGGPAARRRAGPAAAPAAAGPAGRHRQRDLVRAGRADPAGRGVRVQRAARAGRADRAQPAAARAGSPGRGAAVHRSRGRRAATGRRVLPVPGLRPGTGRAAGPTRGKDQRRPGRSAAAALRHGGAAGQRVRR